MSWAGPQRAYARHVASLPNLVRLAQEHRAGRAGWDAPIGLIHAGDPEAAEADGYVMAVAVAAAMQPGATVDSVVESVLAHSSCLGHLAGEFIGRLERLLEIAAHCDDVFALYEPFYREFLVTFPPWEGVFTLEMVPAALAICVIARGDGEQAVIGAANLGRDADTIAGMAGELAGALGGRGAFPSAWVDKVLRLNPEPNLERLAEDLSALIVERARDRQRKAAMVLSLI